MTAEQLGGIACLALEDDDALIVWADAWQLHEAFATPGSRPWFEHAAGLMLDARARWYKQAEGPRGWARAVASAIMFFEWPDDNEDVADRWPVVERCVIRPATPAEWIALHRARLDEIARDGLPPLRVASRMVSATRIETVVEIPVPPPPAVYGPRTP